MGIGSGLIAVFGLAASKRLDGWNAVFLSTTVLTSVTGFFFPFHKLMPSHIVGVISLLLLAIAIVALYSKRLAGAWRRTYAITATFALYLNFFVLVAQLFMKVPALKALAPHNPSRHSSFRKLWSCFSSFVLGTLAVKGRCPGSVQGVAALG